MSFNTEWRVVDNYNNTGRRYFVVPMMEMAFEITDDGIGTGFFLAAAAPQGGLPTGLGRYPALAKGEPGFSPTLVLSSFVELAHDDPTDASCDITPIADATDVSGPVFGVNLTLHAGAPGADGAALITPTDYGTPSFGQQLTVAAGATAFELTNPPVAGKHWPAALSSVPAGTTAEYTMGVINVAAGTYLTDWYPDLEGTCQVVGSSSNLRCDLIVRRDDETGGAIVARGFGMSGAADRLQLTDGPDPGAADSIGRVPAGNAATFYLRTKKVSGSATYSADAAYARYSMIAIPV